MTMILADEEPGTIPSDFLAKALLFNGRPAELRDAVLRLKRDDYETILKRYSDREEWVHINALIVELHHVPLSHLLLHATSPLAVISGLSNSLGMYHSFLWYARLCLVNACAAINPPAPFRFSSLYQESSNSSGTAVDQLQPVSQRKQDEMLEICLFAKSALYDLIKKSTDQPLWYRATCCQMAFEIGNYYWLIDDYEMTLQMMDLALDLLNACSPGESIQDCIWVDFEIIRVLNIKKVCCVKRDVKNDEFSLCSKLLAFLGTNAYQDADQFLPILMGDICEQNVSIAIKRIVLRNVMERDEENARKSPESSPPRLMAPPTSLVIAITYSITVLRMKSGSNELASFLNDKTASKIGKIRRELLPNLDTQILLDTLQEARQFIPVELLPDWLFIWQVIAFVHIAQSSKDEQPQSYAFHPFIQDFFDSHKQFLPLQEKDDPATKDRSKSSPSYQYFLREMLFTQINPAEKSHLQNLIGLVSQHGTIVVPHLLNLAKRHVNTEPLIALELLAVCQKIPLEKYAQSGYSHEAFERELVSIQRDAVICGLVDKAQELLNEGSDVSSILDQFFQTDDLSNPSSLSLFSKTLNTMMAASKIDAALSYAKNVYNRIVTTNPSLANAVILLGNSLGLLFTVERNLMEQNVLAIDGSLDLIAMGKLENEPVAQYCLFTLQLLNWVGHDLIHEPMTQLLNSQTSSKDLESLLKEVFQEIVGFLNRKERHPSMLSYFVGCFGGRLSKQLPSDRMLSIDLLGPSVIFSIPFKGFSSQPGPLVEAPVEIKEKLVEFLPNLQHDTEVMSPQLMNSGLRILKMLLESRIESLDLDQKRGGEYWLLGDVSFALNDHEGAIRAYVNEILVATQFGASMDLLKPYRTGTFFKRMAEAFVSLNDFISAAFFLQFELPSPPYKEIFGHLSKSLPSISGTIPKEEIIYDPPWKEDASPAFAFFDLHIIEYLVSSLSGKPKDEKIVKMLISRLKGPLFDPHDASVMDFFIGHLLNWYLVRLCAKGAA